MVASLAATACTTSTPAGPPHLIVDPRDSLVDQPVRISASGFADHRPLTLDLSSVDAQGRSFRAVATFTTDAKGSVDLDAAAPTSGAYAGVHPMGLFSAMSTAEATLPLYFWAGAQAFTLTATQGDQRATTTFTRGTAGMRVQQESPAVTGFFGQYWAPARMGPPAPAVLYFGGSEGGLGGQLLGSALAARGIPTLSVAYFGEPGLPATLSHIPLEYFAGALRWLAHEPGIDPRRLFVIAVSRGSEAALLLAAHYPQLVNGVVAASPSDVALGSFPPGSGAAWTFEGRPVPFTRQFDNPAPSDVPSAVIPLGPHPPALLLVCGGRDLVWTSCTYSRAIVARLDQGHDPNLHLLADFPDAGHGLFQPPYEPGTVALDRLGFSRLQGSTPSANADAADHLWPRLLAFLGAPNPTRSSH